MVKFENQVLGTGKSLVMLAPLPLIGAYPCGPDHAPKDILSGGGEVGRAIVFASPVTESRKPSITFSETKLRQFRLSDTGIRWKPHNQVSKEKRAKGNC